MVNFLVWLNEFGIILIVVFGGFEGESYVDILIVE